MDEQEKLIERGKKCIKRLEILQYTYFNGRFEWTNIHLDDLELFMAYNYFGTPVIDNDEVFDTCDSSKSIFMNYSDEHKLCISNMIKVIRNNFIKPYVHKIDVGFTLVHSICKNKCDVCHNFPEQDIHQWYLLRIKLSDVKVVYIDLYHNRTYKDWNDYIENNNLPKGYMFYPESGFYDESKYLSQSITPNSRLKHLILSCMDAIGMSSSFASCIILAGGIIFPIMAPALLASAAATITTASVWDIGRQISNLSDMGKHNESLVSKQAGRFWFNLSMSALGAITAPISATVRTLEITNSTFLASKYGRSLLLFQRGACISQCSLEILRLYTNVKNNDYKITLSDCLSLRLDMFVVMGTLLPIRYIQSLLKCLVSNVYFTQLYKGIKEIPYYLGQSIFISVYFVKDHLSKFCEQVLKFLYGNLTSTKCMLAWKKFCEIMNEYNKQLPMLSENDLLNHIVNDIDIKSITGESEKVKAIFCGEFMIKLLSKLNMRKDRNFIIFSIEYIMEKSINIDCNYNESLMEFHKRLGENIEKFDEEFCEVYKLNKCDMAEYVLAVIKETINDTQHILKAYHEYKSRPENIFNEKQIASHTNDDEQLKMYQVPGVRNDLDSELCMAYAQQIDSVNNEYNNYTCVQPEKNEYVLFSICGFSIKIIFFRVDNFYDELILNISFYKNEHNSINRRLQW